MKLHKRYIYILTAVFSAVAFLYVLTGHIYRLRTETAAFCKKVVVLICEPGIKANIDILDEHRTLLLDIFVIIFGLSLMLFLVAWLQQIKKKIIYEDSQNEENPKKTKSQRH